MRRVVWLSARQSYGEVVESLEEEGDLHISKSTVWHLVQRWGARIGDALAAEEAVVKAEARVWSTPRGQLPAGKQGVAVDGGMMFLLGEGWKEFKVGCVFDVEPELRTDPQTDDYAEFGHAVNLSYVASLAPAATFGWQIWTEAHRRGWQQAQEHQVVGDGAGWIWRLRDEHFPHSETLVDWYHATEHLGQAKMTLYPEDSATASRWYNPLELALFQGHAARVAQSLDDVAAEQPIAETAETLQKEAQYFYRNQRRMQYQDMRDQGWPIGSGMVESGAKRVKHRFAGAGMRWSRRGATHLLPVRAAVMTSKARFDGLWERALANLP